MTAVHVITEAHPLEQASGSCPPRLHVADLPTAERLLLRSLRLMAESQENWSMVQQELWLGLGLAAIEPILQNLENLLGTLALSSRRSLTIRTPVARRVHPDEHGILVLLAALQMDQLDQAAAHVRWLVRPGAQQLLLRDATLLAKALQLGDLRLGGEPSSREDTSKSDRTDAASNA